MCPSFAKEFRGVLIGREGAERDHLGAQGSLVMISGINNETHEFLIPYDLAPIE